EEAEHLDGALIKEARDAYKIFVKTVVERGEPEFMQREQWLSEKAEGLAAPPMEDRPSTNVWGGAIAKVHRECGIEPKVLTIPIYGVSSDAKTLINQAMNAWPE